MQLIRYNTWIFLNRESELMHPPPSLIGWLITIGAVQHVWNKVSDEHKFKYLETRNQNQNALDNTFGAIHLQQRCPENSHH
jgi:hypothetical protein